MTYRCWRGVCGLVSSSCFNVGGFTDWRGTDRQSRQFVSSSWFNVGFIDVVPMLIKVLRRFQWRGTDRQSAVWSHLPGLTSVSMTYRCWGGVCSLVSSYCFNMGFIDVVPTGRVGSFVSSSWFNVGFTDVVPMLIKEESAVLSLPGFTSVSLTWYRPKSLQRKADCFYVIIMQSSASLLHIVFMW